MLQHNYLLLGRFQTGGIDEIVGTFDSPGLAATFLVDVAGEPQCDWQATDSLEGWYMPRGGGHGSWELIHIPHNVMTREEWKAAR